MCHVHMYCTSTSYCHVHTYVQLISYVQYICTANLLCTEHMYSYIFSYVQYICTAVLLSVHKYSLEVDCMYNTNPALLGNHLHHNTLVISFHDPAGCHVNTASGLHRLPMILLQLMVHGRHHLHQVGEGDCFRGDVKMAE